MYLNVVPSPSTALPSVRGLGAVRIAVPQMVTRPRGFGAFQQGCVESDFATYMQQWLLSLSAPLSAAGQADAAAGCGTNGAEACGSPQDAAQQAFAQAQEYCSTVADGAIFGCPPDPACSDPIGAAGPYVTQALAIYQSFPPGVWSQAGSFAPSAICPAGTFQNPVTMVCQSSGSSAPAPVSTLPAQPAQQQSQGTLATLVTIQNLSRPGQPFQVGDQYQLVVTGVPGADVIGTSIQNGGAKSESNFGATNSGGTLTIVGVFSQADIGNWQETWQTGSIVTPASLNFTVSPTPSSPAPSNSTSQGGSGGTQGQQPTSGQATTPTPGPFDWLTNDVNLFGNEIPLWGLVAAGAALLFLIPKGKL
jgi:hypothetical protein